MADLSMANLSGAALSGATLSEANLWMTNLHWASLTNTDFNLTRIDWTVFGDVDLSKAKGLETVIHTGPSTIGIDTLYRSRGNLPEVFLRGCGVPDAMITFARSLVGNAIEYYSCFISYSSLDQVFAERLHTDLRGSWRPMLVRARRHEDRRQDSGPVRSIHPNSRQTAAYLVGALHRPATG